MNNEQFEKYQLFTENTIHKLSEQVTLMEKKLDMFSNLLEISKYINKYIKDPNLFPIINDMLIGVFGAKHSNIYIRLKDNSYEAAAEHDDGELIEAGINLIMQHNESEFVINSEESLFNFKLQDSEENNDAASLQSAEIHSCLGVPVEVDNKKIGFIVIQHTEMDYFTKDHAVFLSLIGNHIGIAIENNMLYKQIIENSNRDGLTGIFNKRYFFDTLYHMTANYDMNYTIILLDLDGFKHINDKYGHPFGDLVLKEVSRVIKEMMKTSDIVARYGGDEIIIFLNNFTDHDKLHNRINAIRDEMSKRPVTDGENSLNVTASIGVYIKENSKLTLDEVIKKADENMYKSKKCGKNMVTMSWD